MAKAKKWTETLVDGLLGPQRAPAVRVMPGAAAPWPDASSDTLDFLAEGIYRTTLAGKLTYANRALVEMSGFASFDAFRKAVNDLGTEWFVDPRRRAEFQGQLLRHGLVRDFVSQVRRFGSSERLWIAEDARLVADPVTGKPAFYEGAVRDVTALVHGQRSERRFERLANQVPGGLFQLVRHPGGRFAANFASPGFRQQLDLDDDADLLDVVRYFSMVHEDDRAHYLETLKQSGQTLTQWQCEFRVTTGMGRERWLSVAATPELEDGTIVWFGYCTDISERKANEVEIHQLAYFDPMTGLANRRHITEALGRSLTRHRNDGGWAGLICVDIDRFKTINDTYGHEPGDRLLVEIGKRLKAVTWIVDLVARVDGDEFAILCEDLGATREAALIRLDAIAIKVQGALREPFTLDTVQHQIAGSQGVVAFNGDDDSALETLRRSEVARDVAKRRGGDTYVFFDDTDEVRGDRGQELLGDLNTAMNDGSLTFYLQPQLDADGRVRGCEALMRWQHPHRGNVPPSELFPLIENAPTMTLFTQWAVARAIDCLRAWRGDPVLSQLTYSLNITPHSLTQELAFAQLCEIIRANSELAPRLVMEITERVLAHDKDLVHRNMQTLRALGVQFSIDDFGTGFSSLAYLKSLTFDELKVDGTFISDLERSSSDQALVRTILAVAQTLNMRAVAERVETEQQRVLLVAYGCEMMQGFRFKPALPICEFEAYALSNPPAKQEPAMTAPVSGRAS